MNWGKDGKLGEIGLDDSHTLLVFSKDDREYVQSTYIDKLVIFNSMVDECLDEMWSVRKDIERMIHYKDNKKLLWSYFHHTKNHAATFYRNFERMEIRLNNLLRQRVALLQEFHTNAMKFHEDQTIQDKKFAPINSSTKEDLITLPGINTVSKQITSESFKRWEWFGLGRSLQPVSYEQDKLFDQISRYYIKSHGSFAAIGDVIRLLVISPDDLPDDDIGELIVANAMDGGDILFRVVLDKLVHHDPENNFLCNSSNVYLVSRR